MLVKFVRDTVAAEQPVFVGQELELEDAEAAFLVRIGKCVPVAPEDGGALSNSSPSSGNPLRIGNMLRGWGR